MPQVWLCGSIKAFQKIIVIRANKKSQSSHGGSMTILYSSVFKFRGGARNEKQREYKLYNKKASGPFMPRCNKLNELNALRCVN